MALVSITHRFKLTELLVLYIFKELKASSIINKKILWLALQDKIQVISSSFFVWIKALKVMLHGTIRNDDF